MKWILINASYVYIRDIRGERAKVPNIFKHLEKFTFSLQRVIIKVILSY